MGEGRSRVERKVLKLVVVGWLLRMERWEWVRRVEIGVWSWTGGECGAVWYR